MRSNKSRSTAKSVFAIFLTFLLATTLAALPAQSVREARRLLNSHIERAAPVLSECARAESECFDTDEHRAALDRLSVRLAARSPGQF